MTQGKKNKKGGFYDKQRSWTSLYAAHGPKLIMVKKRNYNPTSLRAEILEGLMLSIVFYVIVVLI